MSPVAVATVHALPSSVSWRCSPGWHPSFRRSSRFDSTSQFPFQPQEPVALNLLALSLGIAAAISVLLAIGDMALPDRVVAVSGQPMLADVLWLLPVTAFSASASSALQSWFIRRKQFPALAQTRLLQSTASSGSQIGLGFPALRARRPPVRLCRQHRDSLHHPRSPPLAAGSTSLLPGRCGPNGCRPFPHTAGFPGIPRPRRCSTTDRFTCRSS